ncbi:MAG: cell division protein FtsX [Flavobacteriaceae bacterium]
MSASFEKYQKRRLISSYFSVILSITLVLFLVGVLGLLVINASKVEKHFKEQIALSIDLKDSAKDIEIKQLQQNLKLADYVKSSRFVSKEEAATIAQEENGEEFMDFIGYNPFQNSIDVFLNSEFVTLNSLEEIKTELLQKNYIDEVRYDIDLVSLMNKNVKRISFWLIAISAVFAFIAMLLINSSIRLAVYSKRFIIKTMQMVGATKRFIRKPFIWKSIRLGIIGSLIAVVGLVIIAYYLDKNIPELQLLAQPTVFAALCTGVVILGIVITWISTFFATQRFLNLKTEDLYY